jgi:hypothetical protein
MIERVKYWWRHLHKEDQFVFIVFVLFWLIAALSAWANSIIY